MPIITINGIKTSCKDDATIMEAAHDIGIAIPSLCHTQGFKPGTSCMVCVVKVKDIERLLPACATKAVDGQEIFTDTPEVIESRRMALELLLSDHAGDCEAPCRLACPASLNIPQMLRAIKDGAWQKAATIATSALILPETLGYVCPAP